jgi:hypothetical protein
MRACERMTNHLLVLLLCVYAAWVIVCFKSMLLLMLCGSSCHPLVVRACRLRVLMLLYVHARES